jgi:hypothetical protein
MTFKYDFCLPEQGARTITGTTSSACQPSVFADRAKGSSPLIGVTFTITP